MRELVKIQLFLTAMLFNIFYLEAQNMMISGGNLHTSILCTSGAVYEAGDRNNNQDGQGIWDNTNHLSPVAVPGVGGVGTLTNIKMVDAGSTHHTVALTNSGDVIAFGNDYECQMGQGSTVYPGNPVYVKGIGGVGTLTGIKYVVGSSESSYAIRASDGALIAWGRNDQGQMGNGTTSALSSPQCTPVLVSAPCNANVIQVDGGDNYAMALLSNGTVYAWGDNTNYNLGNGNNTDQSSPVQVLTGPGTPLTNVVSISCGDGSGYAIKSDGTLWAWGHNGFGELGLGNCTTTITYATQVTTGAQGHASGYLQNVKQVVGGNAHAVVLTNDGSVYTMGSDQYGQLGDGTVGGADACGLGIGCRNAPYKVSTLSNITGVSEGDAWSFAVTSAGQVYSWGQNNEGQLGINSASSTVATPTAMAMPAGCVVLPVTLVFFKATLSDIGKIVDLSWMAAEEKNSDRFEVERSADGISYKAIGTVKAIGNLSKGESYSFYDYNPDFSVPVIYYRLKMIDKDGRYSYSNTEAVILRNNKVLIYPVPAASEQQLNIVTNDNFSSLQRIQLSNVLGKVVSDNVIEEHGSEVTISLAGISPGIYSLQLIYIDNIQEYKISVE